jgi:predicted Rossmann fold nucleotide-binding protein DprA/Smf involved in DNA uptake
MTPLGPGDVLIVALTSRALPADEKPFSSKEVWTLLTTHSEEDLARWAQGSSEEPVSELAARAKRLLQRGSAAAAQLDQWDNEGVWTLTAASPGYPSQLRDRLGMGAPAVLHGLGDPTQLQREGLGVVGSRSIGDDGLRSCQAAAEQAAERGLVLVSGGARGTDAEAMAAAVRAGGCATGILADSLRKAARSTDNRRLIHDERLCLATPYHPDAPFSAATAMGRNKIIYGLSRTVFVVASDKEKGGTWSGAIEAIKAGWCDVAVWTGPGSGPGNAALVERGAREIASEEELWDPSAPPPAQEPDPEQLSLDL